MAVSKDLVEFVDRSLLKGKSREDIFQALKEAGWENDEIRQALAVYHDSSFPIPVPSKRYSLAARDTVFYLFLFTTLYLTSWGVIYLAFNILELLLPSSMDYASIDAVEGRVRYWVSWCIIFAPTYLFTAWKAEQRTRLDPNCPMSNSRQWLTYLTLFLAAITALGDAVALVSGFLSGDMTLRFLLEVLVVALVSTSVIAYYYSDIKKAEKDSSNYEA